MPRIENGYGGNYYQPPKKTTTSKPTAPKPTTPPKTNNSSNNLGTAILLGTQSRTDQELEQQKYLEMMESSLMEQWAAANKPSPVSSFFGGLGQAAQQFFQNTFMAPFTGQYYTPPATNQYAYNPAFQKLS